jgi:CheY-like chemotaxis protein
MEAVGQLAGGIAHDFNNMLAVIHMQCALLLEEQALPSEVREGVSEILAAAERASNLTRQLLLFSRRQVSQPIDLDIGETTSTMTRLMRRVLGEDIRLETRFAPGLPLVHADPGMMEQVLMNLAINARDAMPDGGTLTIALEQVQVDATRAALHAGRSAGRYVCLTVSDTGTGIAPDALPHIFEPFFTTKEVGKGTGLGLATVFGVVEQHQGWIEVESTVGRGTSFRVLLPAVQHGVAATVAETAARASAGTETILLVEDEPAVRASTRRVLELYGYRVIEAESGEQALSRWAAERTAIRLVVMDLVMPGGLSGRQLADRLLAERPDLPVLFITGYSPDIVRKVLKLDDPATLLRKPFGARELAEAVRRVLDRGRA